MTQDGKRTPQQSAAGPRPQLPKRFYQTVTIDPDSAPGTPVRILLDGRPIRTPAKRQLAVAVPALAEALADEWRAQTGVIDPTTMPLTRLVNTALDGVTGREADVRTDIVGYGGSDLVCYLAAEPADLVERQQSGWGPVQRWAEAELGVPLRLSRAVQHVEQDPALLPAIEAALRSCDALALAALHVMTTLTGSALLALASLRGVVAVDEAWALAHIDEDYQVEKWGADPEARRRRDVRWKEMNAAGRLLVLLRSRDHIPP